MTGFWVQAIGGAFGWLLPAAAQIAPAVGGDGTVPRAPAGETLTYRVEWRLIHAGNARLAWSASSVNGRPGWEAALNLESVGLVSRLYKVNNAYRSRMDDRLCVQSSLLSAAEGGKQRETQVTFDGARRKAAYKERDLVKNKVVDTHELDIRPCEHDVVAALYRLRSMSVPPGQSVQIPVSDGKKAVMARVEAQQRDTLKIKDINYNTIRYEAFLFNGVLYRRKGRLFVWLTEDRRRLPVQIRVRLPFYIGTVTLELDKEGKS